MIRFKAWNKDTCKMADVLAIDWNDEGKIISCHIKYEGEDKICKVYPDNEYGDSIELIRYTPHKDRNKKHICDGCILKKEGFWDIRIEYDKGAFWVRDLDSVRYNNLILNTLLSEFNLDGWVITGNIYLMKSTGN